MSSSVPGIAVHEIAVQWWSWIAPLAWQATWIGALALLVDRSRLRRTRPELSSAVWLLFFARLALPPGLSSPFSISGPLLAAIWAPILASGAGAASDPAPSGWLAIAFVSWLAVAVACIARSLHSTRRFERSLALDFDVPGALAVEFDAARKLLGLRRAPRLATADRLDSPIVIGLLRPCVIVPRELAMRGARAALRHALLHELAHVRRRDLWSRAICQLLTALFWFHPLAWIAAARLARTRELLCDAHVAELLGPDSARYRESLAEVARGRLLADPAALAFHSGSSRILERLAHLERPIRNGARRRLAALAATVCAGCVLLPMASRESALAASARRVLDAQMRGERQSCFVLHAAAMALADAEPVFTPKPGD